MTTFAEFHPESAGDALTARLREAVVSGAVPAGSRLVEQSLAQEFGVSRGPVREAVRRLAAEGLVVLRANRSAVVAEPTFDDLVEVYAIRSTIGALAIEHAVAVDAVRPGRRERLDELLERMTGFDSAADQAGMVALDLEFQSALVRTSRLDRASAVFDQTSADVRFFVTALDVIYDHETNDQLIERHRVLLRAMERGETGAALEAWRRHMDTTVQEFSRVFDERDVVLERPRLLGIVAR